MGGDDALSCVLLGGKVVIEESMQKQPDSNM